MSSKPILIIGAGIAGITVSYALYQRGIEHRVMDSLNVNSATRVAVGLYNPVVLKRLNVVWRAREAYQLLAMYSELEELLNANLIENIPFYKKLNDQREANDWDLFTDDPRLQNIIELEKSNSCGTLKSSYGFGVLRGVGVLNTDALLTGYRDFLSRNNGIITEWFDNTELVIGDGFFEYHGNTYSKVIYCNGVDAMTNSPFTNLPIQPNKGEWIIVTAPGLVLDGVLNSSVFVKPFANDLFIVGSTYDREITHPLTTNANREFLITEFEKATGFRAIEVIDHQAGIRPTSGDRKPMVGEHPKYPGIFTLNALGSRGILHAPLMAQWLCDKILHGKNIPREADVSRFKKRLLAGS